MAQVIPSRMTAEIEGDFVVFLIGMRINKPWMIHKWLPVFLAMPRMLKELEATPRAASWGTSRALESSFSIGGRLSTWKCTRAVGTSSIGRLGWRSTSG